MSSNNFFHKIYTKKSTEELQAIAVSKDYASDAKLCAITVLKERNEPIENLLETQQKLIEQRDLRSGSKIDNRRYKTGTSRLLALIIDGIILSLFGWFFKLFNGVESIVLINLINLLGLITPYLYHILFHGACGQTIGKMVMDIKVYDVSETKVISYKQALIRDIIPLSALLVLHGLSYFTTINSIGILIYMSIVMSLILVFWSILEIITMLFNKKRRALHDFIARTVVLKMHENN
ncbi:hypothetical protein GCQ56_17985 [Marinifilum sp. N1E240]|uniref:RDD family protein n=1 Tax=Marinifilum sp. N1E240 TaxID=2608082 RepID=UPI00128E8487|nr:RDD family protein [Marinifilum sp. N1E240]MPQ48892.1 hypothetical protein [Marinifilum sp. N1E240]